MLVKLFTTSVIALQCMLFPLQRNGPISLVNEFPPIYNQATTESCTTQSVISAAVYHMHKKINPSRLDLYYNTRTLYPYYYNEKHQIEDSGTTIEDAIQSLSKTGACDEIYWPFKASKVNVTPSPACRIHRQKYHFHHVQLPNKARALEFSLRHHTPVIVGIQLPLLFYTSKTVTTQGVYLDTLVTRCGPIVSQHAMVVVGVDNKGEHFLLRNSWGYFWGMHGYVSVPASFINKFLLCAYILEPF